MKMTVAEIAALCGGRLEGDGSAAVTAFYTDSRETQPGKMFVPIRGEKTDAHRFIPQVFAAGAAATFRLRPAEFHGGRRDSRQVQRVQRAVRHCGVQPA